MNKLYKEENIQAIGNAIREKGGTASLLKVEDMAQAIADIPEPTGTQTVTENGTYNVAYKEYVAVNVPQTGIEPTGTYTINENGFYNVRQYENVDVAVEGSRVKVNPTFRDTIIIPDQYNTGAKGILTPVDISQAYDTLNITQSGGNYVINGYANAGCKADCYIENVSFDKQLSVTNPAQFGKVVRVHFNNCSFITVFNLNGPTVQKPSDTSHVEYIFTNCTFTGTIAGMYFKLDKCAITKTHADAVNPTYEFTIENSYIYDLTDKADSGLSVHVDGIQMAGNNTFLGGNFLFNNVRIELPKFHATVNAPYMYQVDYNNFGVSNIETKNSIFNGGGYVLYLNAKTGEWRPHTVTDVRIGSCDDYGMRYPTPEPPNATLTRVERNTALYVSSVIHSESGITYYVTNDDVEQHTLRILTNLGENTYTIPANSTPAELMSASGTISAFSQLPIDIEKTLSGNIEYAIFYDDTTNEQIRFVNYTDHDIYIGGANIESLTVTANGTYTASGNVSGYSPITVNVPQETPNIESLTVTQNGTYSPTGDVDGYAPIVVNVPTGITPTGTLAISENGVKDVTNYASVNVNVAGGVFTKEAKGEITIGSEVLVGEYTIHHNLGVIPDLFILYPTTEPISSSSKKLVYLMKTQLTPGVCVYRQWANYNTVPPASVSGTLTANDFTTNITDLNFAVGAYRWVAIKY